MKELLELENIANACMVGNIMLLISEGKGYLYDCAEKEFLEEDVVLNKFLKQKLQQKNEIAIECGEGKAVYILLEGELYRHVVGGNSMELIADRNNQLSQVNETASFNMAILKRGRFYFPLSDGKLLSLSYGSEVRKETMETIEVFQLMEEFEPNYQYTRRQLEVALRKYESVNPDIKIEYHIGMMENFEGSIGRNEIIKNLNMELLAGKGPDILVLNDLPVDTYMEKGVLVDLSDLVNKVDKEDGLYPKILDDYREENGSIYRIPLGFTVNLVSIPSGMAAKAMDLEELVAAMERLKEEKTWFMDGQYPPYLLARFAPTCINSWIGENGELKEDKLLEFFRQMNKTYQLNVEKQKFVGMEEFLEEKSYEELEEFLVQNKTKYVGEIFIGKHYPPDKGILRTYGVGESGGLDSYTFENIIGEDGVNDFAQFSGQGEKIYNPKSILGINVNSDKQEKAKEVVSFLLSAECNFGVNETGYQVPIISINQKISKGKKVQLEKQKKLASAEELEKLDEIIQNVETPSLENIELLEEVIREGCKVLWNDCTPEEAVAQVKNKLEILSIE